MERQWNGHGYSTPGQKARQSTAAERVKLRQAVRAGAEVLAVLDRLGLRLPARDAGAVLRMRAALDDATPFLEARDD